MNILTGKCKEDFETYYIKFIRKQENVGDRYYDDTLINQLYQLPLSMKYGVLIDFFGSEGIYIEVIYDSPLFGFQIFYYKELEAIESIGGYINRLEARNQAIEKANELYNKNNSL